MASAEMSVPSVTFSRSGRSRIVRRATGRGQASITPAATTGDAAPAAAAAATMSSATRSAARTWPSGSTPRQNRVEASVRRLWRRAVRPTAIAAKSAASIRTAVVVAAISLDSPPMIPAMPTATSCPSQIIRSSTGAFRTGTVALETEDPRLAVEGRECLAGPGETDAQPAARQPVEVVGVGRLAELEHRVVRGVDDRVDRPHAAKDETALDFGWRGDGRDPGDDPGGEAPAGVGRLDDDAGERADRRPGLRDDRRRDGEGQVPTRREVPGDPRHAQAVGPVRLDLEVEHDVGGEPEVLGDRRAELEAGRQGGVGGARRGEDEEPRGVGAETELGGRAQHPVRRHPAHLAAGDLDPAGEARPDRGERHDVADDVVPGPADDLDRPGPAGVDDGEPDAVGTGDRPDLRDTGDDDAGQIAVDALDALDDEPERVELGTERGDARGVRGVDAQRRELAQPGKRDPHTAPCATVFR